MGAWLDEVPSCISLRMLLACACRRRVAWERCKRALLPKRGLSVDAA